MAEEVELPITEDSQSAPHFEIGDIVQYKLPVNGTFEERVGEILDREFGLTGMMDKWTYAIRTNPPIGGFADGFTWFVHEGLTKWLPDAKYTPAEIVAKFVKD